MHRHDPIKIDPPRYYKWVRILALLMVLGLVVTLAVTEPWREYVEPGIQMSEGDCMMLAWATPKVTAWNYCCFQEVADGDVPFLFCKMTNVVETRQMRLERNPSLPNGYHKISLRADSNR